MQARWRSWPGALGVLVAAAAALRFSTLAHQSFWLDEAVTHQLVTRSLWGMLRAIPHSESTPPLYYVLAWGWTHVFGSGEGGIRSLSAVFGTATVVLLALIARRVAGDAAGIAAAALCAANPLLIWYSQEARAYALLVMLCALSLWLLQRGEWRGWAIAAAAAIATHYFALFIVGPQLAWIAWRHARDSRTAAWSAAAVVAGAAALAPLAIVQAGGDRAAFIRSSALGGRLAALPKQFLIGYATPHQAVLTVVAVALAGGLALSLRRSDRGLFALAAIAVGVPIVLALLGADFLITRNLIAAMVPLVVLGAVAAARTPLGPALVGGLCAIGVIAFAGVEGNVFYQRDDWRAVAQLLGPATTGPRVVVLEPASGAPALELYTPLRELPPGQPFTTREIDVVDLRHNPPAVGKLTAVSGFHPCLLTETAEYDVVRYCGPGPVMLAYGALNNLRLADVASAATVLVGG